MPLKTTVIGSWPKPNELEMPDWFRLNQNCPVVTNNANTFFRNSEQSNLNEVIYKASKKCVKQQIDLGIDVITDGELNRENYIYYFCRHVDGFDFNNLTYIAMRNSATGYSACVARQALSLSDDNIDKMVSHWRTVQQIAADYQCDLGTDVNVVTPVKVTIPGPLTIVNSTADAYYHDSEAECKDLVMCINKLVNAYAEAGCKYIQIDEPLLVRQPDIAVKYGINNLERCFEGVGNTDGVERIIHLCCGYPNYMDQVGYQKADKDIYFQLAPLLDNMNIDAVSIEDEHRRNDVSLFGMFTKCKVIMGVIAIASSRVESVDEIKEHINSALQYIDTERLIISPDCGLGYLSGDLLQAKLSNMVTAARAT